MFKVVLFGLLVSIPVFARTVCIDLKENPNFRFEEGESRADGSIVLKNPRVLINPGHYAPLAADNWSAALFCVFNDMSPVTSTDVGTLFPQETVSLRENSTSETVQRMNAKQENVGPKLLVEKSTRYVTEAVCRRSR